MVWPCTIKTSVTQRESERGHRTAQEVLVVGQSVRMLLLGFGAPLRTAQNITGTRYRASVTAAGSLWLPLNFPADPPTLPVIGWLQSVWEELCCVSVWAVVQQVNTPGSSSSLLSPAALQASHPLELLLTVTELLGLFIKVDPLYPLYFTCQRHGSCDSQVSVCLPGQLQLIIHDIISSAGSAAH